MNPSPNTSERGCLGMKNVSSVPKQARLELPLGSASAEERLFSPGFAVVTG